jgi:hypothetical protein
VRAFIVQLKPGASYVLSKPGWHVVGNAKAEEASTRGASAIKKDLFMLFPPK